MSSTEIEQRFEAALTKARTGETSACIDELVAIVEDYPDHLDACGHLGYLLQMTGRTREAVGYYERYLELCPGNPEALERLGDCYYTLGDRKKAYRTYRALDISSIKVQQRLSMTTPLSKQIFSNKGTLARLFFRRIVDPKFLTGLIRELWSAPRAEKAFKTTGRLVYAAYLSDLYLKSDAYRIPIKPCDFCGATDAEPVFFFKRQKKVRCKRCGLEFVERRPAESQDVQDDWYNMDSSIDLMEKNWHNETYFNHRIGMLEGAFEEAGLPFPKSGESLFEIGCAQGHVLEYFRERGLEVAGIETGAKLVEHCREKKKLDVTCATVRGFEPSEKKFDYVFAYHVLEHLEKPSELFEKACSMLREGGFLFIEVPTARLTELLLAEQLDEYHGYGNIGHLHYFHMDTLAAYFEKFGFEPLASYEYHVETLASGGILGRLKARRNSP